MWKAGWGEEAGKEASVCVCVMECWSLSGIHTSFACYLKHSILKCTENGECWVLWLQKGQGGGGDTVKVFVGLTLVCRSESLLNKDSISAVR